MSVRGGPDISEQGLVLCLDSGNLRSYPGSGTTWNDLSGNGYNGTLLNNVHLQYSSNNLGYFTFVPASSHYVTTTGMGNYSYTNGITVSVWHYNGGTVEYRGIVNNGTIADRVGGFDLRYGRENYFGGTNNGTALYWTITNSTGTGTNRLINANINEWHNYVGTYDNTTVRVYKDGVLFDSVAHSVGGQLKTMADSTSIGWSPGTTEYLDGRLANLYIYNRALTANEILQNFNATRSRFGV